MEQIAGPDESSWFASPIPSPTTCFKFPRCSYSAAIVCLSVPGILGVLRTFQSFPHICHRDLGYNLYACMWGLGLCCMARSNCHRGRVQCHAPACARTSGIYQQDHQGPCHVHRCAVSRLCSEPGSLCQEHTPMQQQNCLARGESTSGLDMKASDSIGTIGRSKMNEHELVPEGSCACVLCMCVCGDGGVLSCLFTSYTAVMSFDILLP